MTTRPTVSILPGDEFTRSGYTNVHHWRGDRCRLAQEPCAMFRQYARTDGDTKVEIGPDLIAWFRIMGIDATIVEPEPVLPVFVATHCIVDTSTGLGMYIGSEQVCQKRVEGSTHCLHVARLQIGGAQ